MIDPADDVVVEDPPAPTTTAATFAPAHAAAGSGAGTGANTGVSAAATAASAASVAEWESVRRRCRTAEQAVYAALAQYAKAAGQFARLQQSQPPSASTAASGAGGHAIHIRSERNEKQQSGFVTGDTRAVQALATQTERQLEQLLGVFAEAVEAMARVVESGGASVSATAESTLSRFQSVLYDHQSEFKRTRDNIAQLSVRDQLLADASGAAVAAASRSNTDLLLREKESLHSSLGLADDAIATAVAAKGGLDRQRGVLQQIGLRLGTMGSAFPRINALIGRIQRHKQRDAIILAIVIAGCMCFTIFYVWNK